MQTVIAACDQGLNRTSRSRQEGARHYLPLCALTSSTAFTFQTARNGGSRASRTWKIMTQRDEGAGLKALLDSEPG